MAAYLEFEEKIKKIEEDIIVAKTKADEHAVEILEKKLEKEVEKTFKNLSDYQKLQLARHPDRPYSLDYIRGLLTDAYEIHGDRHFVDDKAILAKLEQQKKKPQKKSKFQSRLEEMSKQRGIKPKK